MTEHEQSVQYINEYIARARAAQAEFEKMTQEQVDLAVDLYSVSLGEKVEKMFVELIAGKGAIRSTLKKYVD